MEIVIPPRDHGPSTFKYMWDENGEVTQISRIAPGQYAENHSRNGSHGNGRRTNSESSSGGGFIGVGGTGAESSSSGVGDHHPRGRGRGRQTVQWPFQSVATGETTMAASTSSPTVPNWPFPASGGPRRATWQNPKRIRDSDEMSVDTSIVPDYVVNYIRGETPETLRKKRATKILNNIHTTNSSESNINNNNRNNNAPKTVEKPVDIAHPPDGHRRGQSHAAHFEGFTHLDDDSSRLRSLNAAASNASGDDLRCLTGNDLDRHRRPRGKSDGTGGGVGGSGGGRWPVIISLGAAGGWRSGVALNVLLGFFILLTVFVCFAAAVVRSPRGLAAETVLFSGSCAEADRISWGLHALVNVFGVVLLAGANYAFQVLTSPTRLELDRAHAGKRWMDIGIPSVRNFAYISNVRVFMALVLVVAAVMTQIIYNAIIFTSQSGTSYKLVLVSEAFLNGAPFSNATATNAAGLSRFDILALQDLANRDGMVNLTRSQCLAQVDGDVFATEFDAVVLVANVESGGNSLIQTAIVDSSSSSRSSSSSSITSLLPLDTSTLQFCLAEQKSDDDNATCAVSVSSSLLGIAALLNLVSVVITAAALFQPAAFKPLVTLGDAVSSFLRVPDETTKDACLMTKTDVWQKRWGFREAKYWVPKNHYFFQSASLPRWVLVAFVWVAITGLAAAALGMNIQKGAARGTKAAAALSAFGSPNPAAVYALPASAPASAAMLLAALPQLLLGVLYLTANSLLTTFFLSHESSQYALGSPRPLRVSADPVGEQTTSLFLTLPRPASWFLVSIFAGLGFVLSQSIFVVAARPDGGNSGNNEQEILALGLSDTGLLALLALLVALATVALGIGLWRAPAAVMVNGQEFGNPLVLDAGSCSAVISARSHRDLTETDAHRRKLCWGVVTRSTGMVVSHCTYSSRGVMQLDMSRSYA